MSKQTNKLDAAESFFFQNELESVKSKAYDVLHGLLKAREIMPVSYDADPAADSLSYEMYDSYGIAKILANYADDFPSSDVKGTKYTVYPRSIGSSYNYSIMDIRRAQMAGKPLEAKKMASAMRSVAELENSIAADGDTVSGLYGFLNNANVTAANAPNGAAGTPGWSTKTADEIVTDFYTACAAISTATGERGGSGMTVCIPKSSHMYLSMTRMTETGESILEYIKKNISDYVVDIKWWEECSGAGAGSTNRAVFYVNSPDHITLEIPQEVEQFPPQQQNMVYKVNVHERIAGVIYYYPVFAYYLDAI